MNVEVILQPGFPIEKAIRVFGKKCNKEGIFIEAEQRRYYVKPSERRRLKRSLRKNK